jgi:hypothetical protein
MLTMRSQAAGCQGYPTRFVGVARAAGAKELSAGPDSLCRGKRARLTRLQRLLLWVMVLAGAVVPPASDGEKADTVKEQVRVANGAPA